MILIRCLLFISILMLTGCTYRYSPFASAEVYLVNNKPCLSIPDTRESRSGIWLLTSISVSKNVGGYMKEVWRLDDINRLFKPIKINNCIEYSYDFDENSEYFISIDTHKDYGDGIRKNWIADFTPAQLKHKKTAP